MGEIGDVVLSTDGKVNSIIIDVGGFLGIGKKEVAVGTDNLVFMTDKDGNRYLYTNFTKEQLDAAAAYDKSTYSEKRDDQRLILKTVVFSRSPHCFRRPSRGYSVGVTGAPVTRALCKRPRTVNKAGQKPSWSPNDTPDILDCVDEG